MSRYCKKLFAFFAVSAIHRVGPFRCRNRFRFRVNCRLLFEMFFDFRYSVFSILFICHECIAPTVNFSFVATAPLTPSQLRHLFVSPWTLSFAIVVQIILSATTFRDEPLTRSCLTSFPDDGKVVHYVLYCTAPPLYG